MKAIHKPVLLILLSAIFFALASSARAAETGFLDLRRHSPAGESQHPRRG